MVSGVETLWLSVLGHTVEVRCQDSKLRALLLVNYGYLKGNWKAPSLNYIVGREKRSSTFFIAREGQGPLRACDDGEFLFLFEQDLTIELQKLRCDLYFLHAAVLEHAGQALVLAAASGGRKSVTAWALLHHGFRYLSDELGPVDLKTLEVYSYLRALCLKNEPPGAYLLPPNTLRTSRTLHLPIESLPGEADGGPRPLSAIFFLCCGPENSKAEVQQIGKAEAGARLFANALNPLAHRGDGLDGALSIASACACFKLYTAELSSTCAVVKATLKKLPRLDGQIKTEECRDRRVDPAGIFA